MQIFRVGGCVRDELMGVQPRDVDYVVVNSSHEEMTELGFTQVGADFPVYLDPTTRDEFALARTEKKNGVGYHGFDVNTQDVTLKEDLRRRDLTINAMAMSTTADEFFDPFGGQKDLASKTLRHVDDSGFKEDPVRVLRLARFMARWTDFTVDKKTILLCKEMVRKGELHHLTPERVAAEMVKALAEKRPSRFFMYLHMVGALEVVFPELYALTLVPAGSYEHHPEGTAFTHTMMVLDEATVADTSPLMRYCALVHDLGKGTTDPTILPHHHGHELRGFFLARDMADRLKLSKEYRSYGALVAKYHTHIHNFFILNKTTVVDMVADLKLAANPDLSWMLPVVSKCDSRGRTSFFADREYHDVWKVANVLAAVHKVKLSDVIESQEDIDAMPINRRIDVLRKAQCSVASIQRKLINAD